MKFLYLSLLLYATPGHDHLWKQEDQKRKLFQIVAENLQIKREEMFLDWNRSIYY